MGSASYSMFFNLKKSRSTISLNFSKMTSLNSCKYRATASLPSNLFRYACMAVMSIISVPYCSFIEPISLDKTHLGSPSVQGPLDSSTERPDIQLGLNQPPPGVESWVRCVLYPAKKTKLLPKQPLASQNFTIEDSGVPFGDINFQNLDSRAAFGHTEVKIAGFRFYFCHNAEQAYGRQMVIC